MPWKVNDLMSQRYEFYHLACQPEVNISALCQLFGISRKTGYKWLHRYQAKGNLREVSRRPHHCPERIDPAIEAIVVELRLQYPYWGPRKLRRLLEDMIPQEQLPALVTVARILKRQGLITAPSPQIPATALQRFAKPNANDLWQMDLQAPLRLPNGDKIYPVALLDDHSRYLLGLWMLPDATDDHVLGCWVEAARGHGLPRATLTDHGPQFRMEDHQTSAFRVYLWACEVAHIQGRIAHPQTQGKIERFFRTLNLEVFSRHAYRDLVSWQRCLAEWRQQYNQVRPHQELGDDVPVRHYRPSGRAFMEPDRRGLWGHLESVYRRVDSRGLTSIGGQHVMIGRGFAGWTVEARPLGNGCWHFYFKDHFIREYILSQPLPRRRRGSAKGAGRPL